MKPDVGWNCSCAETGFGSKNFKCGCRKAITFDMHTEDNRLSVWLASNTGSWLPVNEPFSMGGGSVY